MLKDDAFDVVHWSAGLWDCLRLYEVSQGLPDKILSHITAALGIEEAAYREDLNTDAPVRI